MSDLQPELQNLLSAGAIPAPLADGPGFGDAAVKAGSISSQGGAAAAAGDMEPNPGRGPPAWPAGSGQRFPAESLGQGLEQHWGQEGWVGGAGRSADTGAADQEGARVGAGFPGAGGAADGAPAQTSADRVAASCLRCSKPVLGLGSGLSRTRHRALSCLIGRSGAQWPGLRGGLAPGSHRTGACVVRGAAACRGGNTGPRTYMQHGL